MRSKKYKTYHKRTLLASKEVRCTFFVLSQGGPKKVKLPPTQRPFKRSMLIEFYECEGKKDHSKRSIWLQEMGLTIVNSMLCSLGFNEHGKGIKYA